MASKTNYENLDKLRRLAPISTPRYSPHYLIRPESTSDHTISMVCMGLQCIVDIRVELNVIRTVAKTEEFKSLIDKFLEDLNLENLVTRIATHDLDEGITGDVNRLFKYRTANLIKEFNKAISLVLKDKKIPEEIVDLISNAKDKVTINGWIAKWLDITQVVFKLSEEVILLGNRTLEKDIQDSFNFMEQITEEVNKFIWTTYSIELQYFDSVLDELKSRKESYFKSINNF